MKRFDGILKRIFILLLTVSVLCLPCCKKKQAGKYPEPLSPSFIWPVQLPPRFSGTLGEVRGYYFHTGIDLKTMGRTGFPVSAPADGTIYRIISKKKGYGNAVYMTHNNNLLSLFGHLDSFEDNKHKLNEIVSLAKILFNNDNVDLILKNSNLSFEKGEIIAYTGESGSGPPHLHFEIRKGTEFLNPLKIYEVDDSEPPVIESLFLCVEDRLTTVRERQIKIKKRWGKYRPAEDPVICNPKERIFFKISCYDRINALNSVAIHKISLYENSNKLFEIYFDKLKADDFIYGPLVYDISKSSIDGKVSYTYFLSRREGNNFSGLNSGDGYINPGNEKSEISIKVHDYAGNSCNLEFDIVRADKPVKKTTGKLIRSPLNTIVQSNDKLLTLSIGGGVLQHDTIMMLKKISVDEFYETVDHTYLRKDDILAAYVVRPTDIVYRQPVPISIKSNSRLPAPRKISIYQAFKGKLPKTLKARFNQSTGIFTAETKTNGYFAIIRDNYPPDLTLPPTHEFIADEGLFRKVRILAVDGLSWINPSKVVCIFDGEILPWRYDNDRYWIELRLPRKSVETGTHHLIIKCSDFAGNTTVFRNLIR